MSRISYQLVKKLREGEANSTYQGLAHLPEEEPRPVIIKLLQPHLTQDNVVASHLAGFLDVVRGLQHEGLAPLWDLGRAGDYYFIIREFIPGISLQQLFQLVQSGQAMLSPAMAIHLTRELGTTIASIHRHRVLGENPIYLFHGGLSPQNIILSPIGTPIVTDIGLDVIFWRDETIAQQIQERKRSYHPPEYSQQQRPLRRGDTYALASLLYQMVMGISLQEALQQFHEEHPIPLPTQHGKRVTIEFDHLLTQFLHNDPEQRNVQLASMLDKLDDNGLIKQATMKKREAMEYLEVLVKENLQEYEGTGPLLFDYPFQIESLLPQRSEIAPPESRFRPLRHDNTGPFHPSETPSSTPPLHVPEGASATHRISSDAIPPQAIPAEPHSTPTMEPEPTYAIPVEPHSTPMIESEPTYAIPVESPFEEKTPPHSQSIPDAYQAEPDAHQEEYEDGGILEEILEEEEPTPVSEDDPFTNHEHTGTQNNLPLVEEHATGFPSSPPQEIPRSELEPPNEPQITNETVALPSEQVDGYQLAQAGGGYLASPSPQPVAPPPAKPPPQTNSEEPLERFGKFVLLNRVALGGMAEVFRAKVEGLEGFQRIVAIKRILPEYSKDTSFIEMFKDEARIAGSLTHPHIIQINELGEIDDTYFISMEFIDGIDLARIIKIQRVLQGNIPLGLVISVGIAICRALHYAHEARDLNGQPLHMIHRDVTPHNVLLSRRGEIKLTDFGIAKAAQNVAKTAVGELKGKLSYMSPEQASGRQIDKRTDIFQLGILLYEMLTLKKMFEGTSDQTILAKIQGSKFPTIRSLEPDTPELLEQIVMKALENDPRKRYQTADEFERDLLRFRDQIQLSQEQYELIPFVNQVIDQRDQLLAQYEAARKEQANKHTFSVWDQQASPAQDAGQDSAQAPNLAANYIGSPNTDPLQGVSSHKWGKDAKSNSPHKPSKDSTTTTPTSWKRLTLLVCILLLAGGIVGGGLAFFAGPSQKYVLLDISTNPPGATVRLDGKPLGTTPLEEKKVPFTKPSVHLIQLYKPGYQAVTRRVRFQEDDDVVNLAVMLPRNQHRAAPPKTPSPSRQRPKKRE